MTETTYPNWQAAIREAQEQRRKAQREERRKQDIERAERTLKEAADLVTALSYLSIYREQFELMLNPVEARIDEYSFRFIPPTENYRRPFQRFTYRGADSYTPGEKGIRFSLKIVDLASDTSLYFHAEGKEEGDWTQARADLADLLDNLRR